MYDAFEHWKRLLNILCRSEEAIGKYQDLYINLISVLYHQLNEIPADFFVDIVSQDNFLTSTLQVCLWLFPGKLSGREGSVKFGVKLPKELSCMGGGNLSEHTGLYFDFSPLLFSKKFSSTATREAGQVQCGVCLFNFSRMLFILQKKKQQQNFGMKD